MGGINIGLQFDDVLGRQARKRRQTEAALLSKQLMDAAVLTPSEINSVTKHYLDTGETVLPTGRARALSSTPSALGPADVSADPDLPQRSTLDPISFKKKQQYLKMNSDTGATTPIPTPPDTDELHITKFNEPDPMAPKNGEHIILSKDRKTIIKRLPNGRTYNTFGYEGQDKGEGDQIDVELAKDTAKRYQGAVQKGDPISPEFESSARSAYDLLGLDFEATKKPKGMVDNAQDAASKATGGFVPPAATKFNTPVVDFQKRKRDTAAAWLQARHQPVTDANINAVIKAGKVR